MDIDENSSVTMYDDDGNKSEYRILATKMDEGDLYMLAEDSAESAEDVFIFKCVDENDDGDDMVFELVDEDHESFDSAFSLFLPDFDALGIEY